VASVAPSVAEWRDSLKRLDKPSIAGLRIERWRDGAFTVCEDVYQRAGKYVGLAGMYRLSARDVPPERGQVCFFDVERQRWLLADWYGLRFLSLDTEGGEAERAGHAIWDSEESTLVIPEEERWPAGYERILVLASGLLPDRAKTKLRYGGITKKLAKSLCEKLQVSLEVI
jgi:hypothetical protein